MENNLHGIKLAIDILFFSFSVKNSSVGNTFSNYLISLSKKRTFIILVIYSQKIKKWSKSNISLINNFKTIKYNKTLASASNTLSKKCEYFFPYLVKISSSSKLNISYSGSILKYLA